MKKNASFEIELREMTVLDWNEYVKRVVDANELYFQYRGVSVDHHRRQHRPLGTSALRRNFGIF